MTRTGRSTVEESCRQEIIRMHRIIAAWLSGNVPQTHEAFAPFEDVLAADFHLVHPTDIIRDKARVVADLWQGHGGQNVSFRIAIQNPVCRFVLGSGCLVTYEEWQYGHETTARLSTALLRQTAHQPGVEWLHLHETWLPHEDRRAVL